MRPKILITKQIKADLPHHAYQLRLGDIYIYIQIYVLCMHACTCEQTTQGVMAYTVSLPGFTALSHGSCQIVRKSSRRFFRTVGFSASTFELARHSTCAVQRDGQQSGEGCTGGTFSIHRQNITKGSGWGYPPFRRRRRNVGGSPPQASCTMMGHHDESSRLIQIHHDEYECQFQIHVQTYFRVCIALYSSI